PQHAAEEQHAGRAPGAEVDEDADLALLRGADLVDADRLDAVGLGVAAVLGRVGDELARARPAEGGGRGREGPGEARQVEAGVGPVEAEATEVLRLDARLDAAGAVLANEEVGFGE